MGSPIGLWTSVSGGVAQSQNVDTIANNIANVNTTGFKKDEPVFKEYLTAVENPPSPAIDIPRTIFKDSDFYHFDGREHAMVNVDRIQTDHTQGSLKPTSGPFDVAVEGKGFFTIKTPSGTQFTRSGDFKVSGDGTLLSNDGFPVLGYSQELIAAQTAQATAANDAQANPQQQPARNIASVNPFTNNPAQLQPQNPLVPINLKAAIETGKKIAIMGDGSIYSDEELVGKLAVAEFSDPKLLSKTASTSYENKNPQNVPRVASESKIHQGFLEGSNVEPVTELMNLLRANRIYESNMKAIKTYNDMAGKEANEVGKL